MIEQFPFFIALIGSVVAAAYDLKTTEIPDNVFHAMIALGAPVILYLAVTSGNYFPLLLSFAVGGILLGFGFLMYKGGQWGGADAKLLAALGFLLPQLPPGFAPNLIFPFPLSLLLNVFLLGTPYMILYSIVISINNREVINGFLSDFKANSKFLLVASSTLFIILFLFGYFISANFSFSSRILDITKNSVLSVLVLVGMFSVYKFARNVENHAFRRKIPISKLRVGDVLMKSKEIEGITLEQLKKIKKSRLKYVWIKDGVRFGPAFPIALLFTVYYGDTILALSRLLIGF